MFRPSLPSDFGGDTAQMENVMRMMSGGVGIGWALGTLLIYPLVVLAICGVVHLCAMLFGAAKNGYGATVRAYCYAQGPNIFGIIPCFGFIAWNLQHRPGHLRDRQPPGNQHREGRGHRAAPVPASPLLLRAARLLLRRRYRRAGQRDGRRGHPDALGRR
jgi:hypothetical protein